MTPSPRFFKFAGLCALATALTTLAIHLLPRLWADADTFEEQLELRHNSAYLARLWVVIFHCPLVLVSMYAVGARRRYASPALVSLGFLGFIIFAYSELLRTSLTVFALNRTWRTQYALTADEGTREALRTVMNAFSGVNAALFFIFFTAFFVGTLCYGLALRRGRGLERGVGVLLSIWAALSVPALVDTVVGVQTVSGHFEWVGPYFQPVARAMIGVWLWRSSDMPIIGGST
jgi:hypothetical protein